MSRKLSRSDALEDISTWSIDNVLSLLRKNGLEECCKAIAKRQIDGDELLHLTEGKLALWKSDLTRPLIWELWTFVEEIRKEPERFVEEKILEARKNSQDYLSDTDFWDTDFEDDVTESASNTNSPQILTNNVDFDSKSNYVTSSETTDATKQSSNKGTIEHEETYSNCEPLQEEGMMYENFQDTVSKPLRNVSRLQGKFEKSLAEQLKEQLELREAKKPTIRPRPEMPARRIAPNIPKLPNKPPPQNLAKTKQTFAHESQGRNAQLPVPPPADLKKSLISCPSKPEKCLPKPPMSIRNLDLLANLPTRTDESEDEYEPFDEQIIEQNQKKSMSRVDSKQSLGSGRQSSAESIYKPPSIVSHEEEEQYEIYESITEAPEDNGYYLCPRQRPVNSEPPPLPAKPPPLSSTSPPPPNRTAQDKSKERSPDKKSATLPHSGSNSSISSERATRPLPPPPDRQSYTDKPWFHNVTREQAIALIKDQSTYGSLQDGYFLLRPSTTNAGTPLVLVLWYKDRVYNIPVRKRPDNRYALGTAKVNEQTFGTVEEIVAFHSREELVLHTEGIERGSIKLTDTPPK